MEAHAQHPRTRAMSIPTNILPHDRLGPIDPRSCSAPPADTLVLADGRRLRLRPIDCHDPLGEPPSTRPFATPRISRSREPRHRNRAGAGARPTHHHTTSFEPETA